MVRLIWLILGQTTKLLKNIEESNELMDLPETDFDVQIYLDDEDSLVQAMTKAIEKCQSTDSLEPLKSLSGHVRTQMSAISKFIVEGETFLQKMTHDLKLASEKKGMYEQTQLHLEEAEKALKDSGIEAVKKRSLQDFNPNSIIINKASKITEISDIKKPESEKKVNEIQDERKLQYN